MPVYYMTAEGFYCDGVRLDTPCMDMQSAFDKDQVTQTWEDEEAALMNRDVVANADGTDFTVGPEQVITGGMGASAVVTITDGPITKVTWGLADPADFAMILVTITNEPDFRAITREIARGKCRS